MSIRIGEFPNEETSTIDVALRTTRGANPHYHGGTISQPLAFRNLARDETNYIVFNDPLQLHTLVVSGRHEPIRVLAGTEAEDIEEALLRARSTEFVSLLHDVVRSILTKMEAFSGDALVPEVATTIDGQHRRLAEEASRYRGFGVGLSVPFEDDE